MSKETMITHYDENFCGEEELEKLDKEVEEMEQKALEEVEEQTLYDTTIKEKAEKYDKMMAAHEGRLYKLFVQQMNIKATVLYSLHKGYKEIPEKLKELEQIDYEILKELSLSLKANVK